ncbi:MAG: hypothetical protein JWO13_259 [Acidobacteriales bacterium]|nr:hypothetical protein [Terriglobales bacterium]
MPLIIAASWRTAHSSRSRSFSVNRAFSAIRPYSAASVSPIIARYEHTYTS